jgi:oxaloacetate decarboxylase beta subunit
MRKIIGSILTILGTGITILSLIAKIKGQMAFSIDGADGPTSVFLAGKVGGNFWAGIVVGVILFAIGIFAVTRKNN